MENLPEVAKPKGAVVVGASLLLDVSRFEHAQRVAKMLSTSTMVPDHFRDNIGNCVIALNLADRFMADPFMVMQNVYIVHGKPGLEGKLVIALVNQCGKFTPLQFLTEIDDKGHPVACTAFATHKETKEKLEQTVTWKMVQAEGWDRKSGSKWLTMPELMFKYRSATFFARVYCPEVILGMQTVEEILDFVDMTKAPDGTFEPSEADKKNFAKMTEGLDSPMKDTHNEVSSKPGKHGISPDEQIPDPPKPRRTRKKQAPQAPISRKEEHEIMEDERLGTIQEIIRWKMENPAAWLLVEGLKELVDIMAKERGEWTLQEADFVKEKCDETLRNMPQ